MRREPVGVCGLITPWNWPINQISCKVAPALAAGCTVVLKPSEVAPLSAHIFAEILQEAGVPKGVFNMVDGDGPTVGEAISRHPGHRHGVLHRLYAGRRTGREGGGRHSEARFPGTRRQVREHHSRRRRSQRGSEAGVLSMIRNTGQSCNAPSRMLIPAKLYDEAVKIAKTVAGKPVVGDPKLTA